MDQNQIKGFKKSESLLSNGFESEKQSRVLFARGVSWTPRCWVQRWEKHKQNIEISVRENK